MLLKNFRVYALGLTDQIKRATQDLADHAGRPLRYLASSCLRKEDLAREIAKTHRYMVNPQGRETITAMLAAREANMQELLKTAA